MFIDCPPMSGDETGRWWTIPIDRSKNKKAHRVYLTDTALELIVPLKVLDEKTDEVKPKGFIFPRTSLSKKNQPMTRLAISQVVSGT